MTEIQIIYELLRFIPQFFFALFCFYFIGNIVGCPLNLKHVSTWLHILALFAMLDFILILFSYFLPRTAFLYICRILFIFILFIVGSLFIFRAPIKVTCSAVLISFAVFVLVLFFLDFIYTLILKMNPTLSTAFAQEGLNFENLWSTIFFFNIIMTFLVGIVFHFFLKAKVFIVQFINQLNLRNILYLFLPIATFMILIYYIGSAEPSVRPTGMIDSIFCLSIVVFVIILLLLATQNGRIRQLGRESRQALQYAEHLENVMLKTAEDEQLFKDNLLALKNFYQRGDYSAMERQLDALLQSEDPLASRNRSLNALPTGGLKGLLFMKLLEFEKNRMAVDLIFDKDLSHLSPCYLKKQLYYDICKIAGILLDNAREAAMPCAEPEILIEIYEYDRCLYFSLSNNFCQPFELDKITAAGYTTKEKGHGYGLKLAHQLVSSYSELSLDAELRGRLFNQTLKINI